MFPPSAEAERYVGLTRQEALNLAEASGVDGVRVAEVGNDRVAFTMDYRPNRLNLLVEGDRVVRAGFA